MARLAGASTSDQRGFGRRGGFGRHPPDDGPVHFVRDLGRNGLMMGMCVGLRLARTGRDGTPRVAAADTPRPYADGSEYALTRVSGVSSSVPVSAPRRLPADPSAAFPFSRSLLPKAPGCRGTGPPRHPCRPAGMMAGCPPPASLLRMPRRSPPRSRSGQSRLRSPPPRAPGTRPRSHESGSGKIYSGAPALFSGANRVPEASYLSWRPPRVSVVRHPARDGALATWAGA